MLVFGGGGSGGASWTKNVADTRRMPSIQFKCMPSVGIEAAETKPTAKSLIDC